MLEGKDSIDVSVNNLVAASHGAPAHKARIRDTFEATCKKFRLLTTLNGQLRGWQGSRVRKGSGKFRQSAGH